MTSAGNPVPHHVRASRDTRNNNNGGIAVAAAAGAEDAAIEMQPEHVAALLETEMNTVASFPKYRRMLAEIMRWLEQHYPELHSQIVIDITDNDRNDLTRHYNGATHDFRYDLLDPKWVKLFLSSAKKWKNTEKTVQYSFDHPRRYHDAVLKCAGVSRFTLHPNYRREMKAYLDNLKKEKSKAKANSQLDENDADPIGIQLYEQLCKWAVKSGTIIGIFVWAFLTTQWNVMGRTVDVDPLGFHNLRKGQHDSIIFKYDSNKADKKGEKVTPKNCYSNPARPFISLFLALGCYLCINQNKFKRNSDKLFQASGKDGSASNSFSKALKKLVEKVHSGWETIRNYSVRDGHFHPHGVRKGSGTHVTTCTMDPPPIPSVLMRGEWSLGKVLEVYWKYSMIGDTYLGRCLAGFDPDKPGFGVLPPHFREGMENHHINEGMQLCFGGILENFGGSGIEGALLLFLASIVYHADSFLFVEIADHSNHAFLNIPILNKPELLRELQKLVTLEPAGDVQQATGVPRHSLMMDELKDFYDAVQGYSAEVKELKETLPTMVKDAIEEKAAESGQVTAQYVLDQVTDAISKATDGMEEKITAAVEKANAQLGIVNTSNDTQDAVADATVPAVSRAQEGATQTLFPSFKYHDPKPTKRNKNRTDWDVPADFDLPTADLYVAWTAWILGYPLNHSKKSNGDLYVAPVKPIHLLRDGNLPSAIKKRFDNAWRPILELMHTEVQSTVENKSAEKADHEFVKVTYNLALKNVCLKYPDIAVSLSGGCKVSTCSKAVKAHKAKKRKAARMA